MVNNKDTNVIVDLSAKKLLIIIISLQLAFLGSIGIDKLGMSFSPLRQVIGFIYLTFVPGFLILKLLRIDSKNAIEIILYSLGITLSFLMFTGLLINYLYPLIGISKPISETPLICTISIIVLSLCSILYPSKDKLQITLLNFKGSIIPIILLFALLPFVSVFGAYSLSYHNNNILLLVLYAAIAIVPLFISSKKFSGDALLIMVWTISISLLFSISLSIKYLSYGDALVEYYYASLVYANNVWDPSIFGNNNAMLRIVMLHPIYSILLNMELTDVFRVVHPLLYSFTPLALCMAFKKLWNEKIAFLSSFFFMSVFSFFVIFSRNTRTGIAELFIALFILLMTDKGISGAKKSLLSIIFAVSIAVSHYGTSYLFMFALIFSTLLLILIGKYGMIQEKSISPTFSLIYVVFTIGWYIYVSASSSFETLVNFFNNMIYEMSALFSPETSYSVYALTRDWPFSVEISRDLLLIAYVFIAIGIIDLLLNIIKKKKIKLQKEFIAFSIAFSGIALATFLPGTKGAASARVLHLSLCFLAPFAVIGFFKICEHFGRFFKNIVTGSNYYYLNIFSVFLTIFLLFNSGFISEMITRENDYSPNILLSKPRAADIKDAQYIYSYQREVISDQEFFSAKWLSQLRDDSLKIYMDRTNIFYGLIGPISKSYVFIKNEAKVKNGYIYLRTYNIIAGLSIIEVYPPKAGNISEVYPINTCNKIYTNGGSEIYYR